MKAPPLLAALLLAGCSAAPPAPDDAEAAGPGGSMPSADLLARYDDPEKERKLVAIAESTREPSMMEALDAERHPRPDVPVEQWEREEPPSDVVRHAAETFLAGHLGPDARGLLTQNTSVHLSPDAFCMEFGTDICGHYGHTDAWRLSYHFQVRDHVRDVRLVFLADGTHVIYDVPGLPACAERATECAFPIGEDDALRLARDAGLGPGIAEPAAELVWHRTYLWPHGGSARQALVFGTYA